ncbi:hypothetical protein BJ165DRAFT_1356948, partial [Panaeolus papilionaceus]
FEGSYIMDHDPLVTHRDRVNMTAREIQALTGYRWTVHDHPKLATGSKGRYWCSQDEDRKKKEKQSTKEGAKRRDNNGKTRVTVRLEHHVKHVDYVDVSMPLGAIEMIQEHAEWLTPVAMVAKVQASFPGAMAQQIHTHWLKLSEPHWRRDNQQLLSAKMLLQEYQSDVDVFEMESLPDGVEMLAWGMKKIMEPLKGKVVEIGLDATYNAGFPISYCLLSTATSIEINKRTKALTEWGKRLKVKYNVNPKFIHVDKDMAEIAMAREVWEAKISLCWWHLRRAVHTRLAKGALATTPYDPGRANTQHKFIDVDFRPKGQADILDYEGGPNCERPEVSETEEMKKPEEKLTSSSSSVNLPPIIITPELNAQARAAAEPPKEGISLSSVMSTITGAAHLIRIKLVPPKPPATIPEPDEDDENMSDIHENTSSGRHTFCPKVHREKIITMLENHYCSHPLIPGYAPPSPEGIKNWAVRQMYTYCVENDLPELWAYLWENWYRKGRWELWARSASPLIPILKTTMILESHWRRIKHDFLHHFHMPHCDLLVWILVVKLAPLYYRKLNLLLTETGRYRELPSWRKNFKKTWKKLMNTPITMPINDAYRPNPSKMEVPPRFFLEVKRQRTAPFWRHESLVPLNGDMLEVVDIVTAVDREDAGEGMNGNGAQSDEDDDGSDEEEGDGLVDMGQDTHQTYEEAMREKIRTLQDFADGLEYQLPFRDSRMLQALDREGAGLFRLATACLTKERRLRTTRGSVPSTWEQSTSSAMFYRARPARHDG